MDVKVKTMENFFDDNKNILESSNVNFLIGSGISASILATLNDLEDLVEYNNDVIKNQTSSSKKTQIEAILYWRFFVESIYPLVHYDETKKQKHIADIAKFFNVVYKILEKKEDSNLEKQVNVFTTNYDVFFELALESQSLYYNDGFLGRFNPRFDMLNYNVSLNSISNLNFKKVPKTHFNLIKFHGSLNWNRLDEQIMFDYNYLKKIAEFYDKYEGLFKTDYEELKKLYSLEKFCKSNIEEKYDEFKKIFTNRKINDYIDFIIDYKSNFSIVNPTKEKFTETLLSLSYHDMLRLFSTHLEREHVSLFVFGFSFSDEHILKITERSMINPELKIVIFAYDKKSLDKYLDIFSKINSSNEITIVFEEDKNINIDCLIEMYEKFSDKLYKEKRR